MEDEDHITARQQEETAHLSGSDNGTEAYTTEDALSDHDSNRKKAKLRWYGNTKPERDLVKQIKATHRKNLSRILYRAFLIEQRRKRDIIKRRHPEEIAKEDQSTDEEKAQKSGVGLRSRDFITAWPLRPQDLQGEGYTLHESLLIRHKQNKTRNGIPNRVLVDLSGLRPNAVPDQQATTSSSDESVSDDSVARPDEIAEIGEKLHSFKNEPDPRPSAQIEEVLIARLMKISKEKFRKRIHTAQLRTDGFAASDNDPLMTTQLRPLARNLIACLNTFLRGMDNQAFGRGKRRLHYNNWETVMMMASQQGWPEEILQRARIRCNAIFKGAEKSVSTFDELQHGASAESKTGKEQRLCPVETCIRHRIPFAQVQNLKQHMDRSHAKTSA
ncbi:hypothetical protein ZTR_09402 [Talaromyces verruculosus]|nr:hypothetical protein ZTR_09402 [Talaromyces verruculosus]